MSDTTNERKELVDYLRAYQDKITGWLRGRRRFFGWGGDYTESPAYKKALEEYRQFEEKADVDYAPVIEYARDLHDRYEKCDELLDEKADAIIKYMGGGTALFAFGAIISIKTDDPRSRALAITLLTALLPSLICAVFAVLMAIWVRTPRSVAYLADVGWARRMAEFHKTKPEFELHTYLMLSPICEAAHFRCLKKARWLSFAHYGYMGAMLFLVAPVIAGAVCLAKMS